jgi:hypothetical protein
MAAADPYDGRMSERRSLRPAGVLGSFVFDAVLVVAFAIIGRSTHEEGLDFAGVWGTAWPFLAGLVLGWVVALAWRHPLAVWPTGVVVWAGTFLAGMLLRMTTGQGVALAFIIVAALTLAVLLIGWRGIALLMGRRTRVRTGMSAS